MKPREYYSLLGKAATGFMKDGATNYAASIAYYALFCLFPLLLAAISFASIFLLEQETAQKFILEAIRPVLPESEELVGQIIQGALSERGTSGILASVILLWSGTKLFASITFFVNKIWNSSEKSKLLHKLILRVTLFLVIGSLFSLSFSLTALAAIVSGLEIFLLGVPLFENPIWDAIIAILTFAITFSMFLFTYKVVPHVKIPWLSAGIGALVATILFELGKQIFVIYVERFAGYNLVYGPISGVIVLLFWVYVSACILLFGVEVTKAHVELNVKEVE